MVHAAYISVRVDPASAVRLPVRPILNLVCRALAVSCKSIVSTHIHTRKKELKAVLIHTYITNRLLTNNRFKLLPNQNEIVAKWLIVPLAPFFFFFLFLF